MKRNKGLEDARTGVYEISPGDATGILDTQRDNRRVKAYLVNRLVAKIQTDRFVYNGEPIVLDAVGKLEDGQHRLRACVAAGRPITALVVYLPTKTAEGMETTYDIGVGRSPADVLYMSGCRDDEKMTSAVCKMALSSERYGYLDRSGFRRPGQNAEHRIDHDDIKTYWAQHKGRLGEAVKAVGMYARLLYGIVPSSLVAFVYYRAAQYDQKKADTWLHGFATGENLAMDSPILKLRRRFQQDALSKARLTELAKAALLVKMWNAYAEGRKNASLAWDKEREGFPRFAGDPRREDKPAAATPKAKARVGRKERAA